MKSTPSPGWTLAGLAHHSSPPSVSTGQKGPSLGLPITDDEGALGTGGEGQAPLAGLQGPVTEAIRPVPQVHC
jgi:hypothetical protein